MRLLHVYSGNLYGGVETLLKTLAEQRGEAPSLEQHFALCFEGRLSQELQAAGAVLHRLPSPRTSRPWTVLRARRALAQVLERERYDAAICHAAWPWALFAPVLKRSGVPVIFYQHDALNGRHWIERWAGFTQAAHAISNSAFTASTLDKVFPGLVPQVLYYPVALGQGGSAQRAALRAEWGATDETVVIVQSSRLEAWKGHALHLQALAQLKDLPQWVLWVGGGAQREHEQRYLAELKALAQAVGIADRIRYIGQRSDIPAVLRAADIHCQPNVGPEPFGIAFIEAMDAALPIVTTRMGGPAEFIDASCGVLVRPEPSELAQALRTLVLDASRRKQLGSAGPARARTLCEPRAYLQKLEGELSRMAQARA